MWLVPARKGILPFLQTSRGTRGSRLLYWAAQLESQRLIVTITEVHTDVRAAVKDASRGTSCSVLTLSVFRFQGSW